MVGENQPSPQPSPIGEGVCDGLSSTLQCNDKTGSCNTQCGVCSGTLPLSLCEREQLLTSLRVIRDAGESVIRCQEARRIGCQEVKLLSVLRTKITSLFSLTSCLPNICSSDNDPLPSPPPREGACSRKSYLRSNNCHCERQNGASPQSPRNDRTNSCKTQVSGAAATLPQRGEGISNYNQIIYNNRSSPQPSPTGEEVSNYKMLKQVQHDTNSSKRTYSPIHLH